MTDLNVKILEVKNKSNVYESWIQQLRRDEKYIQACMEVENAETMYKTLDLTAYQRTFIDDYVRSIVIAMGRANDVCYIAGIKDALSLELPETDHNQELRKSVQRCYAFLEEQRRRNQE